MHTVKARAKWCRKYSKARSELEREPHFGKVSGYVVNCMLVSFFCTIGFTLYLLCAFIWLPLKVLE
jgi:hypothetical protein